MMRYYVCKYYFNALHSFGNQADKMHPHTFTVVLYIGGVDPKVELPFYLLDKNLKTFFSNYQGKYLNELTEFKDKDPNIENIGDLFYEILKDKLQEVDLKLYQLDISENPLSVYQASDRILLPTHSMRESNRNYEEIIQQRQLTGALRGGNGYENE